ncbi:MAG: hypothetical protein CSA70_03660 [Rhodobacterales bacterium]|nr:MAG: hypothetical protein CSA70_03660 [Rhodobacterales bacterium]
MYADRQTISKLYGQEFLDDLTPDDVDDPEATIDEALASASAEIDGYLSARYELPLAGQPEVLKRPCVDIAVYVLANSHTRLTDTIETRYKDATSFLKRLSEGKAGLGRDEPSAIVEGSENGSASGADFSARRRLFGRGRS